jgi:hypothetical protein
MSCSIYVTCSRHDILRGRRSRDLSWIYNYICKSRSGRGVQHHVIKFVSDLRQGGGFQGYPIINRFNTLKSLIFSGRHILAPLKASGKL